MSRNDRFGDITGIEFSPTLAWIARRNAAIYARAYPQRVRIDVVTGDALDYELPKGKLVLFLYNPFQQSLIARLLADVEASLRESNREIYVVYYNPAFAGVFDASTSLERRYAARVPCDPGEMVRAKSQTRSSSGRTETLRIPGHRESLPVGE